MAEVLISNNKYYQVTHFPIIVKFWRKEKPDTEVIYSSKDLRRLRGEITIRENAGECAFIGYYQPDEEVN